MTQLHGHLAPADIAPEHLNLLVTRWKQRYAHNTVVTSRKYLKLLAQAIETNGGPPALHKHIQKVGGQRPRTVIATPADIAKLRAAAPRWLDAAILLALHAGLRRSDLLRITPAAYHAPTQTIQMLMHKTGQSLCVPASAELQALFLSLESAFPHTPVLETLRGKPITNAALDKQWSRLKKKAGVPRGLWLHDLRRTLAVSLYEVSKDLRVVEQMLGHASLQSTIHYLEHRDAQKLKPYLEALNAPHGRFLQ